jgi:hypothetical protein
MKSHDGGCLCGKVRFRVTAPLLGSGYCQCRMCQQNSGAPVVAWVTFPAASFSWISGEPGTYASSAHARRKFCATRGSYLVFTSTEPSAEVSVNTASFDDPNAYPPRKHIFVESRISWFHTADDLPRLLGYGGAAARPISMTGAATITVPLHRRCATPTRLQLIRLTTGSVESSMPDYRFNGLNMITF